MPNVLFDVTLYRLLDTWPHCDLLKIQTGHRVKPDGVESCFHISDIRISRLKVLLW